MINFEVYSFDETTAFLKEFKSRLEREAPARSTYQTLAEELDMGSRTQARKVFKGDLKIAKKSLLALGGAFGFDKQQIAYLDLLRQFEQSKDPDVSIGIYKKVVQLRKRNSSSDAYELTEAQLKLLDNWYHIHILYYFDLLGAASNAEDIYLAFKGQITHSEIEESLRVLQEIDLVEVTKDGNYKKTKGQVTLLDNLPRAVVKKFHAMMIERSQKAVYGIPFEQRYLMASTIPVKKSSVAIINQRIAEFVNQLDKEFSVAGADAIYQLNLQFFHVASKKTED